MSLADLAMRTGLHRVGARPPLREYVHETWVRRQFIFSLARFRIESENQRNQLGLLWVVLKPLLSAMIYGLVFGILIGGRRPPHFILFLVTGVFLFEFFSSTFAYAARAIVSNGALVQSLSFPRIALPTAAVLQRLLQFLPTLGLLLLFFLCSGFWPRAEWLLLIPLTFVYFCFNLGVSLITARLTVHFHDLSQFLPFVTRLLYYTTGVFFSFDARFGDHPVVMRVVDFQPLHEVLTIGRGILLTGPAYEIPTSYWLYLGVWSLVVLAVGLVFFWQAEERYGRID